MNTADRSLAGLDIALRRRFVFREMPPRPDLLKGVTVEGIDIGQLLSVLNQRIEVLLDRDHCLGHAYFLPLKQDPTFDRLAGLFRDQILPLLQEYFFEDWERIRWVLNDEASASAGVAPFIKPSTASANLDRLFGSKAADLGGITRWELNPAAFASVASFRNILSQP
jgi:5-methylcytosine-specific restriction protein B